MLHLCIIAAAKQDPRGAKAAERLAFAPRGAFFGEKTAGFPGKILLRFMVFASVGKRESFPRRKGFQTDPIAYTILYLQACASRVCS